MAVEGVKNSAGGNPPKKAADKKPAPPPGAEAGAAPPMRGGETARATHAGNAEGPGKAHSGGTGGNVDVKV